MTRILVVDDERVTGSGIAGLLRDAGFELAGTARTLDVAVGMVRVARPDVIVCDVMFEGRPDGLRLPELLATAGVPPIPILHLSSWDMSYLVRRAREAGAAGYLSKAADPARLRSAIEAVAAGGTAFPTRAIEERPPSAREIEVIALVASGLSNADIGERLGLSTRTIEGHLGRLFTRYDVPDRARLVTCALERGWITLGDLEDHAAPV